MLNDYHIQYLQLLVQGGVRFLVIGGQARWLANASHLTRDLDVWVSVAGGDRAALESALVAWARKHPQHTNQNWTPPLALRPCVQIAFPENDGVYYLDRAGTQREILTADRIDVLTSLAGLDFDECFERAVSHDVEGVAVRALCDGDLDEAAKRRTE